MSSESERAPEDRRAYAWVAAACCATIAVAGRLVYLHHPWDGDAGMFVCCGRALANGARFCHDIYDNKFPTAVLWSALWWRACGLFWPGYVIGGMLLAGATSFVLARIAKRHAGPVAFWPTLLFSLIYLNFCPVVFGGFQSETALTFFATLAAAFALESLATGRAGPAFVCGLCAGVAAYLKPTGAGVVAVTAALAFQQLLTHQRTVRTIFSQGAAMAIGLCLPIGGAVLYLHATNTLSDMPWLYRQISGYAKQSVWDQYSVIKLVVAATFVTLPFLIRFRSPSDRQARSSGRQFFQFALLWLALEFIAVAMQGRMYSYHFLVLAAPASLVFGSIARPIAFRSTALPLVPAAIFSIWGVGWQIVRPEVPRLPLSDYLVAHAAPTDAVWMDNMSRLLLETNLRPGTRYLQTFPFFNTDTSPLEMGPQLIADLTDRRPKYVILPTDPVAALNLHCAYMAELSEKPIRQKNFRAAWLAVVAYVQNHYQVQDRIDDRTIYVLRNDQGI